MKKYLIIFGFTVVIFSTFSSCKKDYLVEQPFSSYSPSTLTDSLGFEASLAGLYNHFSGFLTKSDNQGWPAVWQVGTDIAFATQPEGIEVPYYNYSSLVSTDNAANFTWGWAYRLINNSNIIISGIETSAPAGMSQTGKNSMSAEAKFFRAYGYNLLATLYGRVPLVTQPLTAPKTDFVRSSLDSVNNLITQDLIFASANLPEVGAVGSKINAAGKAAQRANKYMAMQLLAEAYLRMGKNDLAEQQTQSIINSGKFSLVNTRYGVRTALPGDYYSDMFWFGNERRSQGNKEAIWVLEQELTDGPSAVIGGTTGNAQQRRVWGAAYHNITGMKVSDTTGGRALGRLRLNNWVLYQLYPANDVRNSQYNIRRQYWYNDPSKPATYGKPVIPGVAPSVFADTVWKIAPHTTKWYEFDPYSSDALYFTMTKDFILMRLGETYLLQAEAQVKQGKLTEAATSINALRTRANSPQVNSTQMTVDFVLDERVRELVGEENRRMTLMRTGTLVDRAVRLNSNTVANPLNGISAKNLLLPIPQSEIDLNKDAKLDQNPGY